MVENQASTRASFFSSTGNENEARKAYNPERGIIIFVYKYTCKYLYRTCVKRSSENA